MNKRILYPSRDPFYNIAFLTWRKFLATLVIVCANSVFIQTTHAEDGAALHAKNCIACHAAMTGGEGSVLYTRVDRVAKTADDLNKQINRCQSSLSLNWSNDQISSVQQYLNQSFYHF